MNEKKKPVPGGRVVSTDYRSAYREEEEAKHAREFAAQEEPEKPAAPVSPAAPAEEDLPEQDDFVTDPQDQEEDLLEKDEDSDSAEAEPTDEPVPDQPKAPASRPRYRRRYGIFMGALVLLFALVGVGFLVTMAGQGIYRVVTDDSQLRAWDEFLAPVVMQDPEPFESAADADPEMLLRASIWRTVTVNAENYTEYDELGRTMVPLADVIDSCHVLFGEECELSTLTTREETFFEYDEEETSFHVAPFSSESSFAPYVESSRTTNEGILLRVGYVSATDEWRGDGSSSSQAERPEPIKYMEYLLKADSSGNQYIAAIRTSPQAG